ncbi:glycosyltransferase [Providencia stuartii]|uniref:glycosyltransferase family 2 protein n=1 Tax=Providencia TaxID=586 RepID=UPI00234B0EA3|nr:glycosyltransferase family 2 protein [Providencia sp. PROV268]
MTNPSADITVYITTHNRVEMLKRAVQSVLNQTMQVNEIIIVDDYSTDGTQEYCLELANNYNNIKYIRNATNLGAPESRNRAIISAKSKYITGLDDDDEFKSNRIKKLYTFYTSNNYSFICDNITVNNKIINNYSGEIDLDKLLYFNIVGSQIFTLTNNLRAVNGFNVEYPAWQDYDTWVKIIKRFGVCYKMKGSSYIAHTEHEERITNGKKQTEAFIMFLKNNIHHMNTKHIISLFLIFKMLASEKVKYSDYKYLLITGNIKRFLGFIKRSIKK